MEEYNYGLCLSPKKLKRTERFRRQNFTEEQKEKERERQRLRRQNFTEEQKEKERERQRLREQNFTEEQKEKKRERQRRWRQNFTEEQKEKKRERQRRWRQNLSEEKKEEIRAKQRQRYEDLVFKKKLEKMENELAGKKEVDESSRLKNERRKNPPFEKKEFIQLYDFCFGLSPFVPSLFFTKVLELTKVDSDFDSNFSKSDFSDWLKKNNITV